MNINYCQYYAQYVLNFFIKIIDRTNVDMLRMIIKDDTINVVLH